MSWNSSPGAAWAALAARLLLPSPASAAAGKDARRGHGGGCQQASWWWLMTKKAPFFQKNMKTGKIDKCNILKFEHDFAGFQLTFMTFYSEMESLKSLIWSTEQWNMILFSLAEFGVVDPASLCFAGFAMGLAEGSCTDPDDWHKFALLQIYLPKTRAAKNQPARIAARPVDPANLVLHRRRDWLDSHFTSWSRTGSPVESMSSMWCGAHP